MLDCLDCFEGTLGRRKKDIKCDYSEVMEMKNILLEMGEDNLCFKVVKNFTLFVLCFGKGISYEW